MSILGRYLTSMFIGHLALILISTVALLQLFDVMSVGDDLLEDLGGGFQVILRYSLLRLPVLVTFLLPFSVLLAALMTFGRLHRYSELVAIQALGMPLLKILLMLLPVMMVVVLLHFLISDQLTPRANRALADWQAASETRKPNDIALWLRDGDHLVSIGMIEEGGRRLKGLVIFKRDDHGNLTAQREAAEAVFDRDGWWLLEVKTLGVRPNAERSKTVIAREAWRTGIRPGLVKDLAAAPSALSIARMRRILDHPEIGSRPMHVYQTWLHKSFALPLASLFMVALATASVRGLQRQGGVVLNALVGFGGAFIYFIADGVLQALGEAGSVHPALAAWLPLITLALISGAVLYWVAMPRGRRKKGVMPPAADDDTKLAPRTA
ncbi:MAG: LptF/LptG family permease [Alphaproteobacteria bacterium]|nr:LptF/LptG family permease [Alphaproteobacteria bacterium]